MFELRLLKARDRPAMRRHLLALDSADRADRFMAAVSDHHLKAYVDSIDTRRDIVLGAFEAGRLVALCHISLSETGDGAQPVPEAGISVAALARRRGLARRLLSAALCAAQSRGVPQVAVRFRPDNLAMAALATRCGGLLQTGSTDVQSLFDLVPSDVKNGALWAADLGDEWLPPGQRQAA